VKTSAAAVVLPVLEHAARSAQRTVMSGAFFQAPLAPEHAAKLLDEVLLGRPGRVVLNGEQASSAWYSAGSSHGTTVNSESSPCWTALKRLMP
jgi:hypothetical protein